jgi:hypothetical protein
LVSLPREVQQEVLLFSFGIQYCTLGFCVSCTLHVGCCVPFPFPHVFLLRIVCLSVWWISEEEAKQTHTHTENAPTETSILGKSFLEGRVWVDMRTDVLDDSLSTQEWHLLCVCFLLSSIWWWRWLILAALFCPFFANLKKLPTVYLYS